MRTIVPETFVSNSILTIMTRTLAVFVFGLLITGDASLSYGQDAATRSYVIVDKQSNSIDIPGQGQQDMEMITSTDIDVTKTGDRSFSVKIINVVVEGSLGGNMVQDALIGLEADVILAANGTIESVSGMADNSGITAMGGEAVFKERIQSLFLLGPDDDVSIGSEWSHSTSMPYDQQGMKVERSVDSNYECVGDDQIDGIAVWVVDVSSTIEIIGSGNASGQQMEMEMTGEATGKIYVEKSSGMILSSEQDTEIEGAIDMEAFLILMVLDVHNTVTSTSG